MTSAALGAILVVVVPRVLGVADYGLAGLVMAYVAVLNNLVDFRVGETILRYLTEFLVLDDEERAWAIIYLAYLLDAATGIVALLLAYLLRPIAVRYLLHNAQVYGLIAIASWSLLATTVNTSSEAILQVYSRFSWLAAARTGQTVLRLVAVAAVFSFERGLEGLLWSYLMADVGGSILINSLAVITLRQCLGSRAPSPRVITLLRPRRRELAVFLASTNVNDVIGLITKRADILILGFFRSPVEAGYYSLAKNLVEKVKLPIQAVYEALFPQLARMWQEEGPTRCAHYVRRITMVTGPPYVALGLLVLLIRPFLVGLVFGSEYEPALVAIQMMMWGVVFAGLLPWLRPAFVSMGLAHVHTLVNAIGMIVGLGVAFSLVPSIGYIGSSVAFVVFHVLYRLVALGVFMSRIRHSQLGAR